MVAYEWKIPFRTYLESHTPLETMVCMEFLAWRYGNDREETPAQEYDPTQYAQDSNESVIAPDMEEYLKVGYVKQVTNEDAGVVGSPPEGETTNQNPFKSIHEEMKRRFWALHNKKRTPQEQFEIDRDKVAWAQMTGKQL